nr:ARM repeat superfamily protein [Tanacetum cinerariifolium]
SFKVILKGKVIVVRAKEVTGWVPEFRMEDNSQQQDDTKDESDKNSCDVESSHAKDDGKEVPEFFKNNNTNSHYNKEPG